MTKALDRLAGEMFRTFARFEYALKAAGVPPRRPRLPVDENKPADENSRREQPGAE